MIKENTGKTLVCKTWKTQSIAALIAVIAAVAIPQAVHAVGAVSGLGTSLGETLLPMHLAIFMVGLTAGPWAGIAAGALSPVISFALSGMPRIGGLPFMTVELAFYGLIAGLMAKTELPNIVKLLVAQIAGRAMRAVAVLIAFYGFGSAVQVSSIWTSIAVGLPGLCLQWILVPLLMFWIEQRSKKHDRY